MRPADRKHGRMCLRAANQLAGPWAAPQIPPVNPTVERQAQRVQALALVWWWLVLGAFAMRALQAAETSRKGALLDEFIQDRPAAAAILTVNPKLERWIRSETARTIDGYRMVWEDRAPESGAPAEHVRRGGTHEIVIRVSAALVPVDQILGLAFEAINARGLRRFQAITVQATEGHLDREQYIDAILRVEFDALRAVRARFPRLCPISPAEMAGTRLYRQLLEAPDGFEDFVAWRKQSPEGQRARTLYGEFYETIRRR